jgi:single-strand DNA-binding protein
MKDQNKIFIKGNVGADPTGGVMPSGDAYVEFSLATNTTWKDKNTGEDMSATQWHTVRAYGGRATYILKATGIGDRVSFLGTLMYSKWKDDEGNPRIKAYVRVTDDFEIVSSRSGRKNPNSEAAKLKAAEVASPVAKVKKKLKTKKAKRPPHEAPIDCDSFDDDIPF